MGNFTLKLGLEKRQDEAGSQEKAHMESHASI